MVEVAEQHLEPAVEIAGRRHGRLARDVREALDGEAVRRGELHQLDLERACRDGRERRQAQASREKESAAARATRAAIARSPAPDPSSTHEIGLRPSSWPSRSPGTKG